MARRRRRKSRRMPAALRRYWSTHRRGGSRKRRRVINPFRSRRRRGGGSPVSVRGIGTALVPAATGAVGALLLDVVMSYVPLPEFLRTGWGRVAAQIIGAVALGFVAARVPFVGRERARAFTAGALTIVAYNAIRPLAAQALGDRVSGLGGLADFQDYSMGAYLPNGNGAGVGAYMNPAPLLTSPLARSSLGAYMQDGSGVRAF